MASALNITLGTPEQHLKARQAPVRRSAPMAPTGFMNIKPTRIDPMVADVIRALVETLPPKSEQE
ncbi:hypothetical protein ACPVPU_07425 [Sphingomonas sp. CJ99]